MSSRMKYLVIPGEILNNTNLTASEKIVLSDMKASHDYFVNKRGEAYTPSLNTLTQRLAMNLIDVEIVVESLINKGLITTSIDANDRVSYTL